ncbi:hypothetical protein P879_10394 [Paragonimus westermani]|uniref:Electron transfer flavoprotein alpha/beta-subunit N-terminal domain-containing protein n=1 Tax=Paragonimus westermani TaxID=34504 RepID=A0A8T0D848_9TREM|nr:hypothetical protein P879_10394 [Paragonimus westermani]
MFARLLRASLISLNTSTRRFAGSLVIVEHSDGKCESINLNTISAAKNFGEVSCLVAGFKCGKISEEVASISGVTRVLVADDAVYENGIAEKLTPLVLAAQSKVTASYLVVGCSTFGRDLLPRVAAKLHVSPINDVIAIHGVDTFQRPIYAGNALVTLKSLDPIKCLTIRATAFPPTTTTTEKPAPIEPISIPSSDAAGAEAMNLVDFVSVERHKSDRPELTAASIVISGGRGLKSGDNFKVRMIFSKFVFTLICYQNGLSSKQENDMLRDVDISFSFFRHLNDANGVQSC